MMNRTLSALPALLPTLLMPALALMLTLLPPAAGLRAQSAERQEYPERQYAPRPDPVLATPPRQGTWSVVFTYLEELGAAAAAAPVDKSLLKGRIRSITTRRLGDVTHVQTIKIDAANQDLWSTGNEHFGKCNHTSDWARAAQKGLDAARYFPGTEWLSPDLPAGTVLYKDTECVLYMMKPHPTPADLADPKKLKELLQKTAFYALADAKTKLPLEICTGGTRHVFEFGPPPATLALPETLVAQINQGKKERLQMHVRAPRPY